jgi:hypothetical protein
MHLIASPIVGEEEDGDRTFEFTTTNENTN